jgi:hypothetical protein
VIGTHLNTAAVFRALPAEPEAAAQARTSVRRVCDEVGIVGAHRDDLVLAASSLVSDAYRRSVARSYELQVLATLSPAGPLACVEVREVDGMPLPRRAERGHGLSVAVLLATQWAHGQCGWLITEYGPSSWVFLADAAPESGGPRFMRCLAGLRGPADLHVLTLADLDRDPKTNLGPPCCCRI